MPKCQKLEDDGSQCTRDAKWKPTLLVRPFVGSPPGEIEVNLAHCEEHKDAAVVESFVNDAGWEKIADMFSSIGKAVPVRELTVLDWRRIQ